MGWFIWQRADAQFENRYIKVIKRGMGPKRLAPLCDGAPDPANLEHPNIARFLDGGTTDDSVPYFVLEYVDGEPSQSIASRRS